VAHLEDFGLLQRDQRPARRALILIRDDLPPDRQVAERMAAVGVGVQEGMFANYAQLRWRVDYSAYPAEAFEQVIGWLQPHPRPARPPICYSSEVSLPIPDVRETAMAFGPAPGLFGVLCGPVAPPVGARPTLVFLSPGTTPHMGDDRMWVLMARRFARMGFTSLRFDVAGVGDSSARTGDAAPVANLGQAAADLKAALDWLETVGSKQFILVGYCLGAKVACNLALRDPRVTAQFLINPWRLFWSEGAPLRGFHKPAYYLRAARNPTAWRRVLGGAISGPVFRREARRLARGVLAALRRRISTEETRGSSASCSARAIARRGLARLEQRLFETQTPEQAAAQAAVHRIRSLAARGVNTLLIYGDSDLLLEELEEYFGLGREHLAERLNLHIRLLAGVKHSLLRRSDRDQVVAILEEQLDADRQATADPTAAAERKAVSP
jgi:pimeloyl-ACP methyl ester carboxylesterase